MLRKENIQESVRWGVIGLGKIAHQFVKDLLLVEGVQLQAVASRDLHRANVFGELYGASAAYGSYEALLDDPEVDIVYVATPHASHAEWTIAALNHQKAVLCEKPIALNRAQAQQMVVASQANKVFFMEAFWTRFNPVFKEVYKRVRRGDIGEVTYIQADFSFRIDVDSSDRMMKLELGGGSLLELGVYPVFLAYMFLGRPKRILANSMFHSEGADLQTAMIFEYEQGQAMLFSSYTSQSNMTATISGREGRFVINPIWHESDSFSHFKNYDDHEVKVKLPLQGKGFSYEIEECVACLRKGKIESDQWSHRQCLELIGLIDEVRAITGLRYPQE